MAKTTKKLKKSAQEIQDEIFQKMSAEKKLVLAMGLFRLARKLSPVLPHVRTQTGRNNHKNI